MNERSIAHTIHGVLQNAVPYAETPHVGAIMSEHLDANSIHFSTGETITYTALDQMLEQQNLFEVAKALNVPAQELMQVLKNRPRGE